MDDESVDTPVHILPLLPFFKVTGQSCIGCDVARGMLPDALGDNSEKDLVLQEICRQNYLVYEEDSYEYYLTSMGSELLSTILPNEVWDSYLLYWARQLQYLHKQLSGAQFLDGLHSYTSNEIHYDTLFQHILTRSSISRDIIHACIGHTAQLAIHLLSPDIAMNLLTTLHRHCLQPLPSSGAFASPPKSEINDIHLCRSAVELATLNHRFAKESISLLTPLLPRVFYLPPSLDTSILQVQFVGSLALALATSADASTSIVMRLAVSLTHQLFDKLPRTSLPTASIEALYQNTLLILAEAHLCTNNVDNIVFHLPSYALLHISKSSRHHPNIAYALNIVAKTCVYHNQYADAVECIRQALLNVSLLPGWSQLAHLDLSDFTRAMDIIKQLPPSLILLQLADSFFVYGTALLRQNIECEACYRLSYATYRRVLDVEHPLCTSVSEAIAAISTTSPVPDIDDQPYDTTSIPNHIDNIDEESAEVKSALEEQCSDTTQLYAVLLLKHGLYNQGLKILQPTCLWSSLLYADSLFHAGADCKSLYKQCGAGISKEYAEECYAYAYILKQLGLLAATSDIPSALELIEEAQVILELLCSSNVAETFVQVQCEILLCKLRHCMEDPTALAAAEHIYSNICMNASDSTSIADVILELGSLYEDIQVDKAIAYFRAALDMYRRVLGDVPHASIAKAMNNLAGACEHAEQYVEARDLYETCLAMLLEVYSYSHEELAVVYVNLGSLLYAQGMTSQGGKLLQQAVDIYAEVFGSEHSTVAETKSLLVELSQNEHAEETEKQSYCLVM